MRSRSSGCSRGPILGGDWSAQQHPRPFDLLKPGIRDSGRGRPPTRPATSTLEARFNRASRAGVVVQSTVAHFHTGDRVVAMSNQQASGIGTWADLVALPAVLLAPAPPRAALTQAATLPLAGLTALQALTAMKLQRAGVEGGPLLGAGGRYVSITDDPLPDIPGARGVQVREAHRRFEAGGLLGKVVLVF